MPATCLVPRMRLELIRPCEHRPLKTACLPIPPPRHAKPGRSGGIRTPGLRFWRPPLCQLSYTPTRTAQSTNHSTLGEAGATNTPQRLAWHIVQHLRPSVEVPSLQPSEILDCNATDIANAARQCIITSDCLHTVDSSRPNGLEAPRAPDARRERITPWDCVHVRRSRRFSPRSPSFL